MIPTPNQNFQYITFSLAQTLMGVDILDIREIVPCHKISRVHRSPGVVMGLVNLRGQILTILNIGVLLGVEPPGRDSGSHIIVFKHTRVGFAVDQIGDVFSVGRERLEPVPANISAGIRKYSDTVINLSEGVLILIKAGEILSCLRTPARPSREDR